VEEQYTYERIWGGLSLDTLSSCTEAECNRSKYKGALHIGEEAGIYYMRNRWYEPHTGRFLSEDPIGLEGGINVYVWSMSNHYSWHSWVSGGLGPVLMSPFELSPGGHFDAPREGTRIHHAFDFPVKLQTAMAACGGTAHVIETAREGLVVEVTSSGGVRIRYSHLAEAWVGDDDTVRKGASIGLSGNSGTDAYGEPYGFHLHVKVLYQNVAVNPLTTNANLCIP